MALLDMFDKLDDIVYEPVKAICAWISEPLNRYDHKRKSQTLAQEAAIESAKREQEVELEIRKQEQMARLDAEQRRWNAEIDNFIAIQEINRNKRILDAIIEYRRSMIEDAKSIANSLSHMEMNLVAEAHTLVLKKTEEYKAFQDKAMKECDEQLEEISVKFANNERLKIKREDMVIDATADIIDAAKKFISELNEDIKRINDNNSKRTDTATKMADSTLEKMGATLAIESSF